MTPQALGKARTLTTAMQARVVELRKSGQTIAEICMTLELEGNAVMACVQNVCLQHFGKRDLRGPEVGHLPGKTRSSRRTGAL